MRALEQPHLEIVASLRHCAIAPLRRCVIASLRRCVVASLRHCVVASLRRCVVASLRRCVIASSRAREGEEEPQNDTRAFEKTAPVVVEIVLPAGW
jgi:hypothetical protein